MRVQRIDLQEDVAAQRVREHEARFEGIARTQRGEGDRESQIIKVRSRTQAHRAHRQGRWPTRSASAARATPPPRRIYAAAYNRNPEFYSFYRSLQAYRNSLGSEGDVMVVSPDSEFFRYLKSPAPHTALMPRSRT